MKKAIWSITFLVSFFITNHPVQAQITGIKNLVNTNSGLCLAVRGATRNNGEEGTIWTCDGNTDKNWRILDVGNGFYKLQNMNSNLYLAVGGASRDNGGRVVQYVDQGQQDILWRFINIGSGIYKIQNKNSNLFLAIGGGMREGGAPLIQYVDEGQQDIKWRLVAVGGSNPILSVSQQIFQTEGQLTIRISGAAPNSDVTVTVSNVPLTANQSCRIRTNNEGVGSCILRYPYRTSWCSLTPAYRLGRGIVRATNSNGQIIANTDFGIDNLYSRPVGGNCPNNLTVNVKTGGDDLRGGSSRAFIKFHFRNSGTTTEFPLSSGAAWAGNSWQTRDFAVGTHNPDDLVGVTIRHDGTPNNDPFNGGDVGHTYDNWNIDKIVVKYNGGVELINLGGTPLVRFTGALREQRWNR